MQIETEKEETERRKKKKKKGEGEGEEEGMKGGCSLLQKCSQWGYQKNKQLPWGHALPCQLWETWAITLLRMSVDGKLSFDFIEDLEGMYSNMQCMRGITYLRLCGVFANKLQISLKYAI